MEPLLLYKVMRLLMTMTLYQYSKHHFVFNGRRLFCLMRQSSWKK